MPLCGARALSPRPRPPLPAWPLPALCPVAEPQAFLAIRSHVAKELVWQRGCPLQGLICFPLCSPVQISCQQQISEASGLSLARQGKCTVKYKGIFYQFKYLLPFLSASCFPCTSPHGPSEQRRALLPKWRAKKTCLR